jgi:DNA-binding SARP family transcriptional activator
MEALACLKQSSVYHNQGDVVSSAQMAEEGLALVPDDARSTKLRLDGNIAITSTWMDDGLPASARTFMRIAAEAFTAGWDHFGAIAFHNLGIAQRQMGQLRESLISLEKAAKAWSELPASPFADNSELATTLLMLNDVRRAAKVAASGVQNTAPWPRPHAEAQLGQSLVLVQEGRFAAAAAQLQRLAEMPTLGSIRDAVSVLLIEALYLGGGDRRQLADASDALSQTEHDPRLGVDIAPAAALARHRLGPCRGGCQAAHRTLSEWNARGARLQALIGEVKLGALALDHRGKQAADRVCGILQDADAEHVLPFLRYWLREYGRHAPTLIEVPQGATLLIRFLENDPEYWRLPLLELIDGRSTEERAELLAAVLRFANKATFDYLANVPGLDVVDARRQLAHQLAARIFIRSFGSLTIHRGDRQGPGTRVDKRRLRALLGLLIVHSGQVLSRDNALDVLWPEADPIAAVNSLNQSVFQLRRVLNPEHKDGESPQYLISTPDALQLNPDLVRSDLDEFRLLAQRWKRGLGSVDRREVAERMIGIVRGEFLADLKYEEWMQQTDIAIHAEVRHALLPIAQGEGVSPDLAIRAASALIVLDEFDETAALALIQQLIASGRRLTARDVLVRFTDKLNEELGEVPSADLMTVLKILSPPPPVDDYLIPVPVRNETA